MKPLRVLCPGMAAGLLLASFAVSAGTFGAASLSGPEVRAPLNEPGVAFEDLAEMTIADLVRLEIAAELTAELSDPAAQERAYMELTSLTAAEMFHIDASDAQVVSTPLPGAAWLVVSGMAGLLAVAGRSHKARWNRL